MEAERTPALAGRTGSEWSIPEERILQITNDISEDMCRATKAELIEVVQYWSDAAYRANWDQGTTRVRLAEAQLRMLGARRLLTQLGKKMVGDERWEHQYTNHPAKPVVTPVDLLRKAKRLLKSPNAQSSATAGAAGAQPEEKR